MSVKRKDKRNRVLRDGEQQRKNGQYMFRWVDKYGNVHYVYSWKLEPYDPVPKGKRDCKSLREIEKDIRKTLESDIAFKGGNLTVLELVQKYTDLQTGVKQTTRAGYKTVINNLKQEDFSKRRIDTIKLSDAQSFLVKLQKVDNRSYSSIHTIRGVLRPAFQMAVDDDLLLKNPFDFPLSKVIVDDSVTREAVTRKQRDIFLDFIKSDNHYNVYYDGMYILFHTGMRISEFCGITKSDIDFKNKTLVIHQQLMRNSHSEYYVDTPKTDAGSRTIPMTDEVADCFKRILKNRKKLKVEPVIDGKSGFIFIDKNGNPETALHWCNHFRWALAKYNRIYKEQLPKITPHVCRHTYCSLMAKSGMNPKILQYLMGHSDISVTLNTYTHVKLADAQEEMNRMADDK